MFNLLRVLPGDLAVKNLPANGGDMSSIPGSAIFPGKEMAIHPSIFAWEIPLSEEPGRL